VRGPQSNFPAADDPGAVLIAFTGDLGLDSGKPQSVYRLDTTRMRAISSAQLRPGQTWPLPDGRGSVTLDGYVQWASFTVASDPGKDLALVASLVAITGLALSLLVRRRRVWVRVSAGTAGATLVEVAGLTRSEHASVAEEVDALAATLGTATTTRTTGPQGPEENR
jgi:cytochrome c biogenesis protein